MQGKPSLPQKPFKWNHSSDEIFKGATWAWTMYQGFHWLSYAVAFAGCESIGPTLEFAFLSSLVFSWAEDTWLYEYQGLTTSNCESQASLFQWFLCSPLLPHLLSLLSQCLYLLGVRVWSCRERRKVDAQVSICFLFLVISVALGVSARLQSLWRVQERM